MALLRAASCILAAAGLLAAIPTGPTFAGPVGIPYRDLESAKESMHPPAVPADSLQDGAARTSGSIPRRAVYGLLYAYRAVLSSQDSRTCQFYPSCSHYAEDAIRTHGMIQGTLMASSRLQRCHPKAFCYYALDETRMRLYDPAVGGEGPSTIDPLSIPSPRSPLLASSLSTVLPGAGQVYAGRTWDGVYSFLQIAPFAFFSYRNYRREGPGSIRGAMHGLLALGFYAGGIYGAGRAAVEHRTDADRGSRVVNRRAREPVALEDPEGEYGTAIRDWSAGRPQEALDRFRLVRRYGSPDLAARSAFFESLAAADAGHWDESREALDLFARDCPEPDRESVLGAMRFLDRRRVERERAVHRARTLSTLLPGAGQLSVGKPGAALAALAVNGLLGYYAYETTRTDSWGEFAIFALPTFWRYYRGNIRAAGRLAEERGHDEDVLEFRRRLGL